MGNLRRGNDSLESNNPLVGVWCFSCSVYVVCSDHVVCSVHVVYVTACCFLVP